MIINPEFQSLIPPLLPGELSQLESNLLKDGCRDPLVVWDETLLDGHNRYEICNRHNIKFNTSKVNLPDSDSAKVWIIQNQFGRRNLAPYTRVELALKLEPLLRKRSRQGERSDLKKEFTCKCGEEFKEPVWHCEFCAYHHGEDRELCNNCYKGKRPKDFCQISDKSLKPLDTKKELARIAGVSHDTLAKGKFITEHADEETKKQLRENQASINATALKLKSVSKRRELKSMEWPKNKFRVIYADPPWQYSDARTGTSGSGGAISQYDTMPLESICAMSVPAICTTDSVLFLWATSPLIPEAIEVIKAWGFKYKASFVWDKGQGFNGHYNDVHHELLLIGTKGSCVPETDSLEPSIIREAKSKHSAKPERFRELIDQLYPTGPRVELFARTKSKGWSCWGNELS